jgi:hypothetical protein
VSGVADLHASGCGYSAVHTEGQRLVMAIGPVAGERSECVEVGDSTIGIMGCHDTPADVAVDDDLSFAELYARANPIVFLVRGHAVELEHHPEPATVDRAACPSLLTKAFERAA